ncbi:PREDICTED: uncharacterized protein LOC105312989 [Amphimedon queenslandica]|uniref:Uncharacterized protein n=1 Tax=Amphimedon queenslandica TaxID=400682 RepID=A0A1X7VSC7_AMPQE|nr:PREDICTED: uncharacterized protein LOC105312989 [Amphimedon queenslandica]|eukprot:XP_011404374.1 PREDICTED: uncharacterized protein LOC105312989 [Amphimedon queenslandica]
MDDFSGLTANDILKLDERDGERESPEVEERDSPEREEDNIKNEEPQRESVPFHEPSPSVNERTSPQSSTSSSSNGVSSFGRAGVVSLKDYTFPQSNYERDTPDQFLLAFIGREFDSPQIITTKLELLVPLAENNRPLMKLVPFTVKRSVLVKGNFDISEIREFDGVVLCYNASEARILLTGTDGYYTQLIKRLESVLGPNKVAFLITNYVSDSGSTHSLINPDLKERLTHQSDLNKYLESDQVLSWHQDPRECHVTKLIEIAKSEPNPHNNCTII